MTKNPFARLFSAVALGIAPTVALAQNAVEYPLRQVIKWQRGTPRFPNEPKEGLFDHLPLEERNRALETAAQLRSRYHLQYLWEHSSVETFRLNFFYLEMLDRAFSLGAVHLPASIGVADIGPSDWFYVHGLYNGLQWWNAPSGRQVALTAYEADAFRVYKNLFSRFDYARGYMRGLDQVEYIPKKFVSQPDRFHVITLFFPFIFVKDHLSWGLPLNSFDPLSLLRTVWFSVSPGGLLLIVNQGEKEHEAQRKMLGEIDAEPIAAFEHPSLMYHYDIPRFVLLVRKT